MKNIEAQAGEAISDLIKRSLVYIKSHSDSTCMLVHNGTKIFVYQNSCYEDICDKFELQRKVNVFTEEGL